MNKTLQQLVRPNIWGLKPYSSARDEYKGFDAKVFLDANENPYNAPYNRYPDPLQTEVKRLLAPLKGVDEERIFLGNGSDEAIDLVFRVFCEPGVDNVVSLAPTYGMYEVCADVNNVAYRSVPLGVEADGTFRFSAEALLAQVDERTKAIFLCSPNNPTGQCLPREEVMQVLTRFTGIVVVDEAYADFMSQPSFLAELGQWPRLIVLQTFSKAWACAGIRLGMAFASAEIIGLFNKVKYPYNVNVLTQRQAIDLLSQPQRITQWVEELKAERARLMEGLGCCPGVLQVYPTDANFVLVRMTDAPALYAYLLTQGIIVRSRHRVLLCANCLRITVGTPAENDTLLRAMQAFEDQQLG